MANASNLSIATNKAGKYRVLRPLMHDDTVYPVEGVVELADKHAAPLLLQQTIEAATKEVPLT